MKLTDKARSASESAAKRLPRSTTVHACVEERLSGCSYAYYFNRITWRYERGTLTLEGRVPTFHLKQVLQTMLRDIELVDRIANQVDVVSATGLSSQRDNGDRGRCFSILR